MAKKEMTSDKFKQIANLIDQIAYIEAKDDFWKFCKYVDPVFFNDKKPHLKMIAEKLQEVADGKIKKLAVSLPPRAGKSYIISMFCAWMLGRNPTGSVMRNSYAATLAEKFSKDIRDGILVNAKFKKVFPDVHLSKKNTAVDGWSLATNTQPSYFCAGVGGAITGFGCRTLAILDDGLKNIEEALSETVIEGLWNWYTSTHLSRLETGCPEIHIATRWSKRDPIGRLTDPDSEHYTPDMEVISIPALDDNGNSFCEAVKTTQEYHDIRRITDPFIWEAEFMQHPIEEKGLLLPISELKRFSLKDIAKKQQDGVIGFTDPADLGSDSLCSLIGKRFGEDTYITDVVFSQDGVEITEPLVADLIIRNQCQYAEIEINGAGRPFLLNVKKLIAGRSKCTVLSRKTTSNKETRILMQSGYIKEHFYFRNDYTPGSDYDRYMRQLTNYVKMGRNAHDDACFEAGTMISTATGNKPIENVREGEYVFTPFGLRRVLFSGCTGTKETICRHGLRATPNHKVYSKYHGFINLKYAPQFNGSCLFNIKEALLWKYKRLLYLMESHTALWGREGITSASQQKMLREEPPKDFMLRFGSFITTRQFQKAITFTTRTATLLITTLATWSVYLLGNTLRSTLAKIRKKSKIILNKSDLSQKRGTKARKGESGTSNMESPLHKNYQQCVLPKSVFTAENLFKQKETSPFSVQIDVERDTETQQELSTSSEKVKVYNLCVDIDHVYYANGILVSNCDCTTGLAEMIPYRSFPKQAEEQRHYNFDFERPDNDGDYLRGEVTREYLDFMGGF